MDVEEIMEYVCDRCHYPYIIDDQERLDDCCTACPIEGLLQQLKNKEV